MRALLGVALVAALGAPGVAPSQTSASHAGATVPITTDSEEARRLYLEARRLSEELHGAEAYEKYGEAVAADPEFALAHFGQAGSAPTAAAFFESLRRAVALADGVSPGERHMILALEAAGNGDVAAQREHLDALVAAHPDDARAHFQLGVHLFGLQDFEGSIPHFQRAAELDPTYTTPHNMLGYANRSLRRYEEAERAFQRYVELLPGEPNPLDSYAELLMRTGRFEESIEQYRKALALDPEFWPSYIGIGNDQMLLGRHEEARATFQELFEKAPNDGLRRTALLWAAVSRLHEGRPDEALDTIRRMSAIAEASADRVALAGDRVLAGTVLLETGGSAEEALAMFREGLETMEAADAPEEAKALARRNHTYNEALVAIRRGDLERARQLAAAHRSAVEARRSPPELQLTHELEGRIAVLAGDVEAGIAALELANQQDPRILWAMSRAHAAAGDAARARELAAEAANFNQLSVPYAYVRRDALTVLEEAAG